MEIETKEIKRTKPKQVNNKDLTIKMALDNPIEAMRIHTTDSLYNFLRYFWDIYSNDKLILNWHIPYLCKELEEVARRVARGEVKLHDVIINISPGSTKTALVSIFFPAWCWVNWYWMKFITTSHSSDLSLESAEYSRDIIRSDKFQQLFPEIDIKYGKDGKSNFRVIKKVFASIGHVPRILQGGGRVSTSVDAHITGFHAHIIIPDDIIDPKRALSDVGIQTANNHLKTLATRKTDKAVSVTIMIMQRLHQNDPTGYLLKKKKENIKHICIPGEIKNYKDRVKPKELLKFYKDDLFDPVRMPWSVLKDLEADLGQYGYAGQIGQNPTPPAGGMFKVDRIQTIETYPAFDNIVKSIRYWDKAGTSVAELVKGKKAAFTAGVKMHLLKNGKFLISNVNKGQWSAEIREDIIKQVAEADEMSRKNNPVEPPVEIWVEQEPGSGGKESADNTIKNLAGFIIDKESPKGDKVYRADPFSVQVNNGNVIMLKGAWNEDYIEELRHFPFSTYKDQVDGSSGAFSKLTTKKVAGGW